MRVRSFSLFVIAMLMISLTGCSQVAKTASVEENLATAEDHVESGDLDGANEAYEDVLASDPDNAEANFYTALIGTFDVVTDPRTIALAEKLGVTNLPKSINELITLPSTVSATSRLQTLSPYSQAAAVTITATEVQTYISEVLLPILGRSLERLARVEADATFTHIIPTSVTGSDTALEIDLGEVYALDTYGSFLTGLLNEIVAYNFDYTGTGNPLTDPAAPANFGTLKATGTASMHTARDSYVRVINKAIAGINYIEAETDDQTDDAIPKFKEAADRENVLANLNKVKNCFTGVNTTFTRTYTSSYTYDPVTREWTPITVEQSIVCNFGNFYTTPVEDWKDFYVDNITSDGSITAADFPDGYDFTFSGLFPEMGSFADWN
ncbi:MAG: hypothetical protein ABIH69_00710 [bacterium]